MPRKIRKARRQKLAAIATKAANRMARKKSWCQASWARTKQGRDIEGMKSFDCPIGTNAHYFAANSPKAQKFCVQGFIYNAAGKVFKRPSAGAAAGEKVIGLLDRKIYDDPTINYNDAMTLNDSNGDASRVKLVEKLREVAKDLA